MKVIKKNKNPPKESRERESTHSFSWEKYGLNGRNYINFIQNKMGRRRVKI